MSNVLTLDLTLFLPNIFTPVRSKLDVLTLRESQPHSALCILTSDVYTHLSLYRSHAAEASVILCTRTSEHPTPQVHAFST